MKKFAANRKVAKQKWKAINGIALAGVLAVSASLFSGASLADHRVAGMHGMGMPGISEKMIRKMVHKLDLSEEQRSEVWAIYDEARPQIRQQREQLHEQQEALREAVADGANSRVISELADDVGDSIGDLIVLKANTHRDIHNVLTKEQREKAAELREKRQKRIAEHRRDKREHRH